MAKKEKEVVVEEKKKTTKTKEVKERKSKKLTKEEKKAIKVKKKIKKENKKAEKAKEPKESLYQKIQNELDKVKWPTWKEIVKYTIITIAFCLVLAIFFQLITMLAAFIREIRG